MDILLTNDDGIDSTGLRVLYEGLSAVGAVHVVAPREDQSAVGRALSSEVQIEERDIGFAVHGTPSDCVIAALEALDPDPDLVISGCNEGANLGAYVLGRSGTVSAAVEAAFHGIPAIAVSLYVPDRSYPFDLAPEEFKNAVESTGFLAEHALEAGVFSTADYLNVNAAIFDGARAPMQITHPSHEHEMDASRNEDGSIRLHDRIWERMRHGDITDPPGTDRRAVYEGAVSVSPLTAPHTTEHHDALDTLAESYSKDPNGG